MSRLIVRFADDICQILPFETHTENILFAKVQP